MAVLISNPQSGRRRHLRPRQVRSAIAELEATGFSVVLKETQKSGEGLRLAREAIDQGAELIVVCGGDGTINEVVCGMAHSRVPLAILPGGTANVLARELGLPLDIAAAARAIRGCTPRRVALGRAGQRYFLLMAGVGFDARVVECVSGRWKKIFGMGAYFLEALRRMCMERPARFVLRSGNHRYELTFACIARVQHYGPIRLVREADLFSGQFQIYGFPSQRRLRYLAYGTAVLTNHVSELADVRRFSAREVLCEPIAGNGERVMLQVDGELAGPLPCAIELVPDALTLLVPARF